MKRVIRGSATSSNNTDLQSEYEYRRKVYLKRKHEFETLGEDDNNDVLSREEKMNIAKAEMDKVNPKSVKSSKDLTEDQPTQYALFKKTYSHSREFKDKDTQSGSIRDLIDELKNKDISYEIYDNKTDNGCTVFYDDDGTVTAASYGGAFDIEDDQYSDWRELASKSVEDSDGFNTDYTLYTNGSTFICMFGDKDIYEPDEAYADYETENEEEAYSWFDNYEGFADEDDDDEFDIYASKDIKASMGRYDDYFGQTAAATYGELISDNLKGQTVSKRKDLAEEPGGLIYEANALGIDMWDLLEALEGMCREGRAREIDDSTYEILGSSDIYIPQRILMNTKMILA